jgi:Zn-dependent protease with chaperone function
VIAAAGQAILHATVAALVIEALVRLWRVEDPGERLAMRALAIGAPIVLTTAYLAAAPWRSAPWFADRWALFAGASWNHVHLSGVGLATAAALALSAAGTVLYLRDAVPFLADRFVRAVPDDGLPEGHPAWARVARVLASVPAAVGPRPSTVTVLDVAVPVLLCTGIDRTAIVVSTGTLSRLDDEALGAALAHEAAHLSAHDPRLGWWLMAARTLQFFNPIVQIVARQAIQDVERRADLAVAAVGQGASLASAVHRLSAAANVHSDLSLPSDPGHPGDRLLASAHRRAIDARCQLLLEDDRPEAQPYRAGRLFLAGAAVAALLFLVV